MFKKLTLGVMMVALLASAVATPAEARRRGRGNFVGQSFLGGGGFGNRGFGGIGGAGFGGTGFGGGGFGRGGFGRGGFGVNGGFAPAALGGFGGGFSPYGYGASPYAYGNGFGPYGNQFNGRRRRSNLLPILIGAGIIAAIATSR